MTKPVNRIATIAATLLPLSACATSSSGPDRNAPSPPAVSEAQCNNEALASFIGQKATAEIGAAMLKASGARTLRWGGPGTAMTMDFRPDRLTVTYDRDMVIDRASCG